MDPSCIQLTLGQQVIEYSVKVILGFQELWQMNCFFMFVTSYGLCMHVSRYKRRVRIYVHLSRKNLRNYRSQPFRSITRKQLLQEQCFSIKERCCLLPCWHLPAAFIPRQPVRTISIFSVSTQRLPRVALDMDGLAQVSYNACYIY